MGGMSTRNEIKARLGILAEPKTAMARPGAKAKMGMPKTVSVITLLGGIGGSGGVFRVVGYDEAGREVPYGMAATRMMAEEMARKIARNRGWQVTFARPGAKAKMDLTDVQRKAGYKWRVAYTRQLGKDQYLGGPPVTIQDDLLFATESAARQWADAMLKKGWFKGHGGGPEKILKATVLMASRPGAKAKMDKNADYVEYANLRETLSKLENRVRRAQGEERARLQRELDAGTKRFRELGNRLRAARPGAKATHAAADKPGRKVMAESDPAVSAKIRKLMAEGKPQKQAVAIALDMKRRGEI